MNLVKVKDIILGDGIPKICVPIVAKTKDHIIAEALSFKALPIDIVEWRADWFDEVFNLEKVRGVLKDLSRVLKNTPLLFTFRSIEEGGEKELDKKSYAELNKAVSATGLVDMIDVEAFKDEETVKEIIERAHKSRVKIISSYHDFNKTPPRDEIVYRLRKMQELNTDILKIAVMPKNKLDVLELMEAAVIMSEKYADRPLITIAMSDMGIISRLSGEIFGSAVTFASGTTASAPGQIGAKDLYAFLQMFHKHVN